MLKLETRALFHRSAANREIFMWAVFTFNAYYVGIVRFVY